MKELKSFMAEVDEAEFLQGIGDEYPHLLINGTDGSRFLRMKMSDGRKVTIPYGRISPPPTTIKTDVDSFFPAAGKIPSSLLYQTVDFFRELCRVRKTNLEAYVQILYHPTEGYSIHVPKQTVSAASVTYKWEVQKGYTIIADIHSHNSMGAFFSGTDDADDKKKVGISGVIGKIDLESGSFSSTWRFCTGTDQFIPMQLSEIFDSLHNPAWVDQIEEPSATNFFGTAQSLPIDGFDRLGGPRSTNPTIEDYTDVYGYGRSSQQFDPEDWKSPRSMGTPLRSVGGKTHNERFFPKGGNRVTGVVGQLGKKLEEIQIQRSSRRRRK